MIAPQRPPNPRLGAYYGIFTSAFVSLFVLFAILEQLGVKRLWLSHAMILVPLIFYLLIAASARALQTEEFFTSGRRVPAFFNGMGLAATLLGGIGLITYTGVLFFLGFDGLALALGWMGGLLLASILFLPYLRKVGAYTLSSFLAHRFRSRSVGAAASLLQMPPLFLLIAAEIKLAALVIALFVAVSHDWAVLGVAGFVAAVAASGGMRSITWTQSAQFIVTAIGFLLPLAVVSILLTNLPVPQLTYGVVSGRLAEAEAAAGIIATKPSVLEQTLPAADAMQSFLKPFLQPFGALASADFIALFLCFLLGAAALPSLLMRSGVTVNVAEQRRSAGWGVFLVALLLVSVPAYAVFVKFQMLQGLAQAGEAPQWLSTLGSADLAQATDANGNGAIEASELKVARDGVVLALTIVHQLPFVLTGLLAAAGLAIALAAAVMHLFALGASLVEDVYRGLVAPELGAARRLLFARIAIAGLMAVIALFVIFARIDVLQAAVVAMALVGSTFFPVLVLAIWWEKMTKLGALAAMAAGFTVTAVAVLLGGVLPSGQVGMGTLLAALAGTIAGTVAGIGVSLQQPEISPEMQTYFEELRMPGSDTLHDRALRRAELAHWRTEPAETLDVQQQAPQA